MCSWGSSYAPHFRKRASAFICDVRLDVCVADGCFQSTPCSRGIAMFGMQVRCAWDDASPAHLCHQLCSPRASFRWCSSVSALRAREQMQASPAAWVKPELADSIVQIRADNVKRAEMEAAAAAAKTSSPSVPAGASSASDAAYNSPELVNDGAVVHSSTEAATPLADNTPKLLETEASVDKAKTKVYNARSQRDNRCCLLSDAAISLD